MRRRPLASAAAMALAAVSLAACSSAGAAGPRKVPFGFMGVLAGPPIGDDGYRRTDSELRVMAGAGVESLRIAFYWREGQPSGPSRTDFRPYDRVVAAAARAHVDLLPSVLGVPRWARRDRDQPGSSPANPAHYANFMAALVRRYGPRGSFWAQRPELPRRPIRAWQVWNEPDHRNYWFEQPWYYDYVQVLRAAHRAIKARDPRARVVLAGLVGRGWDQLAVLYRRGAAPYFDDAAVHPFTRLLPDVVRILRYTRTTMRRYGDERKPLIVSELTWPSSKGRIRRPSSFDRTERNQATILAGAYRVLAGLRAELRLRTVYWATWMTRDRSRTDAFDYAGLNALLPSGAIRRKPSFYSYRAVARQLEGCAKASTTACR